MLERKRGFTMSQEQEIRPSDREPSHWYQGALIHAAPVDMEQGEYHPQSTRTATANFKPVPALPEGKSLARIVEDARLKFRESNRGLRIANYVLIGVMVALVVATIVVALVASATSASWGNYVTWPLFALVIVAFVAIMILSSVSKKHSQAKLATYLEHWCADMAGAAYLDVEGVENVQYAIDGHVRDADLINTHYWAVINAIDSRNRILFTFDGVSAADTEVIVECPPYTSFAADIEELKELTAPAAASDRDPSYWYAMADNGAPARESADPTKSSAGRSASIGAFGKFLTFDVRATGSVIVVRQAADTYLPTHLKDYTYMPDVAAQLGEDFIVWGSSREFVRSVLTEKVIAELKAFERNDVLLDWFLSFNNHGLYLMLNFSDDVMELPFKGTPKQARLRCYPDAVEHGLAAVRTIVDEKLGQ